MASPIDMIALSIDDDDGTCKCSPYAEHPNINMCTLCDWCDKPFHMCGATITEVVGFHQIQDPIQFFRGIFPNGNLKFYAGEDGELDTNTDFAPRPNVLTGYYIGKNCSCNFPGCCSKNCSEYQFAWIEWDYDSRTAVGHLNNIMFCQDHFNPLIWEEISSTKISILLKYDDPSEAIIEEINTLIRKRLGEDI
jgi:hypothetical protein